MLTTRFHFHGDERYAEGAIRKELAKANLSLCSIEDLLAKHGVVCFSQIDAGLTSLLSSLSRMTKGMTLALAAPPLSPNPRTIWQLLEQGASEVLVWDGTNEVACQIHARVDRWTTIDELTEYVTSRASLAGESDCWRSLIRRIAEVGRFSDAPVLLIGESGTGKELLARVVSLVDERASKWSDDGSELVVFDCSTVVPELSGASYSVMSAGRSPVPSSRAMAASLSPMGGLCFSMRSGATADAPSPIATSDTGEKIQTRGWKHLAGE